MAASGRRERIKAQNRETILAAARQVFAELGFAAATVRDIIRATPLASGTFYNYFKSKEEVYQALRDDLALAVRPGLREARLAAHTVEEFLAASFRSFFEAAARNADIPQPAGALRIRMDTPEVLAGIAELRADLDGAIARGLLPPVDARHLTAAMVGVGFEMSRDLTPETVEAVSLFASRLFLGGLAALPRQASDVAETIARCA